VAEVSSMQIPPARRLHGLRRIGPRSKWFGGPGVAKPPAGSARLGNGTMPDLALDLRYLQYAILVAEHCSIRRAADALNHSQSTVSRHILLLERRLGVQLSNTANRAFDPRPQANASCATPPSAPAA
jgi:DNA-binding CsgD family transcriptional regulator